MRGLVLEKHRQQKIVASYYKTLQSVNDIKYLVLFFGGRIDID
jgi:hypothetical protein